MNMKKAIIFGVLCLMFAACQSHKNEELVNHEVYYFPPGEWYQSGRGVTLNEETWWWFWHNDSAIAITNTHSNPDDSKCRIKYYREEDDPHGLYCRFLFRQVSPTQLEIERCDGIHRYNFECRDKIIEVFDFFEDDDTLGSSLILGQVIVVY